MSGFDKVVLMNKLIAMGWKAADARLGSCLIPPDKLFEDRPPAFWVYDAKDLQNLLGEIVEEDA